MKLASSGVVSISAAECQLERLAIVPDPLPHPAHALIDFSGHGEVEIKRIAKRLRALAEQRGWQFLPDERSH